MGGEAFQFCRESGRWRYTPPGRQAQGTWASDLDTEPGARRMEGGSGEGGVVLVSRSWPARAFLYAQLREADVDVHGVESVEELAAAVGTWPRRFGTVLMDATAFAESEVVAATEDVRARVISLILVAGPWESGAADFERAGGKVLRKPVAVGEVVEAVRSTLGDSPED